MEIANVDVHPRHLRWHGCWLNGVEITVFGTRSFLGSNAHFRFRPVRVRHQLNGFDFIWQQQVQRELIGKVWSINEPSAVYEASGVGIGSMKILNQRIRPILQQCQEQLVFRSRVRLCVLEPFSPLGDDAAAVAPFLPEMRD